MPQLDISTYSAQLFWLVVSFSVLYIFTARVTIPRIAKILEARWLRIEGGIKRADELKLQTQRVQEEFEESLDEAREQAHNHVMQMIHNVAVTSSQRKKDITSMMLSRIQSAEAQLERQKMQSLDDIKSIAETVAVTAVEKLIEQKVDPVTVEKVFRQLMQQKVA